MTLRSTPDCLIAHDSARDRRVALPGEDDMLAFLAEGAKLRPNDRFRRTPTFYVSNHTRPGAGSLDTTGQTVELEIDGIGRLANRIDGEAAPA